MATRAARQESSTVERDIGALQATVEVLLEEFREERRVSSDYRQAQRSTVNAISESVRVLTGKVEAMEPEVTDLRSRRDQAKGAAHVKRTIYAGIISVATIVAGVIGWKVHG